MKSVTNITKGARCHGAAKPLMASILAVIWAIFGGPASCSSDTPSDRTTASVSNPEPVQPANEEDSTGPDASPAASPSNELPEDLATIARNIRDRKIDEARASLTEYLTANPADGRAVFLMGITYHREQRYSQAIPLYEQALALSPNYMPINHFRGWALYYMGELDQSRSAFEAFLKLNPEEPDSHFALGLIELDQHNLDRAEEFFLKSVQLWMNVPPGDGSRVDRRSLAKAYARLSEVFEQRENPSDLEKAKQHLMLAVDLYPDHYEAIYKLYRVLVRLGEAEQAEAVHQLYLITKERVRPTGAPPTSFPE